jgi:DNA-binding MarR family transcriptional regulator
MTDAGTPAENAAAGHQDPGIAAWAAFLRTHVTVVRVLEREVAAETGLQLSWYDVLLELDAASKVVLSRTRVSRVVDEMVRAGLVAKVPDPTDGRATFAEVTDPGRRELRRVAPVYLRGIREHFAQHLTGPQLEAVRDGLEAVLDAHREAARRG